MAVLVDSSVWVDYFKGLETAATTALHGLLGDEEVVVGDLVVMEVLQGFRVAREVRIAEMLFTALPCVVLGGAPRARAAASNYRLLRAAGVTPRSPIDVLIATFCVEHEAELLASDRDYTLMAPHLGLLLHRKGLN